MNFVKFLGLIYIFTASSNNIYCFAKLDDQVKYAADKQTSKCTSGIEVLKECIKKEVQPLIEKSNFKQAFGSIIRTVNGLLHSDIDKAYKLKILEEACEIFKQHKEPFIQLFNQRDKEISEFTDNCREGNLFFEEVYVEFFYFYMKDCLTKKDFLSACLNAVEVISIICDFGLIEEYSNLLKECYKILDDNKKIMVDLLKENNDIVVEFFAYYDDNDMLSVPISQPCKRIYADGYISE